MKKTFALLFACLLLFCLLTGAVFAAGYEEGEQTPPVEADLDGDGVFETLAVTDILKEDGEACMGLEVKKGTERAALETRIAGPWKLFLTDLDGDGLPEILFTGDECSDDYITYCLRYMNGALVTVPFEEGEVLSGGVAAVSPYELQIFRTINTLGTYAGFTDMRFEDGLIVFDSGSWRIGGEDFTYTPMLIAKQDIYVFTSVGDEEEYGEEAVLEEGTAVCLIETDGSSWVSFVTENGGGGVILLEEDEFGAPRFVNGMPEEEVFEGIEYAD